MKKVYRNLTKDQIDRGVIFSSTLSTATVEMEHDIVHEVMADDPDKDRHIKNLTEDSFFNDSPWKYNIIRR